MSRVAIRLRYQIPTRRYLRRSGIPAYAYLSSVLQPIVKLGIGRHSLQQHQQEPLQPVTLVHRILRRPNQVSNCFRVTTNFSQRVFINSTSILST